VEPDRHAVAGGCDSARVSAEPAPWFDPLSERFSRYGLESAGVDHR